jgi:hypothetical protein
VRVTEVGRREIEPGKFGGVASVEAALAAGTVKTGIQPVAAPGAATPAAARTPRREGPETVVSGSCEDEFMPGSLLS